MIYEFLTRNMLERGKLPRTLWRLVRHPGALTIDFLEGRRQNSIRPVRLYFSLSLLFFLILSLKTTDFERGLLQEPQVPQQVQTRANTVPRPRPPERPAIAAGSPVVARSDQNDVFRVLELLDRHLSPGPLQRHVRRLAALPPQEQAYEFLHGTFGKLPGAMFLLMPAFAFFLKRAFARQSIPFGAHLLFSLHFHALAFFGFLWCFVVPDAIGTLILLAIWAWFLPALRNVYECSWWSAIWRVLVLSALYFVVLLVGMLGALVAGMLF